MKRSGKVQRYSRAKLFAGIYHCAVETRNADRGEVGTKAYKQQSDSKKIRDYVKKYL